MAKWAVLLLPFFCIEVATAAEPLFDPTKPGWTAPAANQAVATPQPKTALTAILIQGTQKKALIGDKYYAQGDLFQGKKITQIEFDRVWLSGPEGKELLTLVTRIKNAPKTP